MEKNEQEIGNFIKEFLGKMGWEEIIMSVHLDEGGLDVLLKTYDAKYLIGVEGQNLRALEHLLRALLKKRFSFDGFLHLDVNEYRREKEKQLREFARHIAQKVAQTKRMVKLPPMSSAERRIIHTELSSRPDIVTESEGEAEERHIIVKPYL